MQSIREIVSIHNAYLSPNAPQLLTKSIVSIYALKGLDGQSPCKRGTLPTIRYIFEKVMALHCRMIQSPLGMFFFLIVIRHYFVLC